MSALSGHRPDHRWCIRLLTAPEDWLEGERPELLEAHLTATAGSVHGRDRYSADKLSCVQSAVGGREAAFDRHRALAWRGLGEAAVTKPRRQTIKLCGGEIRKLRIFRDRHAFRVVVYDDDTAVPLIQANLNETERRAIRKALGPDK